MKHSFVKLFVLAAFVSLTLGQNAAAFSPENDIDYPTLVGAKKSDITQDEFNTIIKKLSGIYSPVVSQHGGRLQLNGSWKDETLNAGARQLFGTWQVQISGGLARHPDLTTDGFSLIVCHELGHHLGGFPIASATPIPIPIPGIENWAAVEGQADYFSTHVCARKIWADEADKNATFKTQVDAFEKEKCDQSYSTEAEQNICYRTIVGLKSVTLTMANLKKVPVPSLQTPDQTAVDKTNPEHPAVQCRLDTLFQGAVCPVPWNNNTIPGKKTAQGQDSLEAERESAMVSCTATGGFQFGVRPACWFKARM